MDELFELYQEVILDHYKNPRHYHEMSDCTHCANGDNPLCGDKVKIFVKLDDQGTITDASFDGAGCAISVASASLMTSQIIGRPIEEVRQLFQRVHDMLTGNTECPPSDASLGKLKVLAGVCEFPVRVKCATLAWHTLIAALKEKDEPISTE